MPRKIQKPKHKGQKFDNREQIFIPKWQRLEQLKALAKAYSNYEPYKAVHDMSKSLSGLKKLKYDKEHEQELVMYENTRADSRTDYRLLVGQLAGLCGRRKNCNHENLRNI